MGVWCVLQVIFKNFYFVGECEKFCKWFFNWMFIGVVWVFGVDSGYVNVVFFGVIMVWWWCKYFFKNFEIYVFVIVVGFIVGEGFVGVINVVFEFGEVFGFFYGILVGLLGFQIVGG